MAKMTSIKEFMDLKEEVQRLEIRGRILCGLENTFFVFIDSSKNQASIKVTNEIVRKTD